MKNNKIVTALLVGLVVGPGQALAAPSSTPYQEMLGHYETVRRALVEDSMEGVTESGKAIQEQARSLLAELAAGKEEVAEADAKSLAAALEEIETAASNLSAAGGLASAREDFFVLTKPLNRYRKFSHDSQTIVAFCSMAEKAWIQPAGEIGNPYLGQEMPRCGEVVGK